MGKGHLVREIDALDGLMGEVADKSGIQFRLLNRSRGPAVRGPRTQSDRQLYKKYIQEKLINYCNLTIYSDPVLKFISIPNFSDTKSYILTLFHGLEKDACSPLNSISLLISKLSNTYSHISSTISITMFISA